MILRKVLKRVSFLYKIGVGITGSGPALDRSSCFVTHEMSLGLAYYVHRCGGPVPGNIVPN